jgi:hypothetical protein
MDADVYGPNLPLMMGVNEPPPVRDEKIQPLMAFGVKVMSIGFLIERDQPAIWRGPIIMKVITQFLRDVDWGQLDYLLVDMPPGTGDAQLSLVQATHIHGGLIVTTPQQVAVGDALRGVRMFERVGVPVLGVVENMSYLENPETGKPIAVFGAGGGQALADEVNVPLLGQIPLDPRVVEGATRGGRSSSPSPRPACRGRSTRWPSACWRAWRSGTPKGPRRAERRRGVVRLPPSVTVQTLPIDERDGGVPVAATGEHPALVREPMRRLVWRVPRPRSRATCS